MKKGTLTVALIGVIILGSMVDIAGNFANLIPFVGTLGETASETILEIVQICATIVIALINQ